MVKILAILRDERFSPNSVEIDRAILQNVVEKLPYDGIQIIPENELTVDSSADVFVTMGRLPQTIDILKTKEEIEKKVVVNSGGALSKFSRSGIEHLMRREKISSAPLEGSKGYWVKRGDAAAQSKNDVVYCENKDKVAECVAAFNKRNITDIVVGAHVEGDLVKFYGVGNHFFRYYYPTDDGRSKFGDEIRNGMSKHYAFSVERLQNEVFRLAELTGIEVYGGDCIVDSEGYFFIIDFNDWPSFSRCREEAAIAIAKSIIDKI